MGGFFTALLGKFVGLASWIGKLFVAVFASAWLMLTDLGCWIFEAMLQLIQTILDGLPGADSFAMFNPAQYVAGLPSDVVNMVGLIRIGECLAIILAAILIKITLQIIPFTRLGS